MNKKCSLKKDKARKIITDIENIACKYGYPKPHLHVSDPITDKTALERGFAGEFNVYGRFPGHPDHKRIEQWLTDFEKGARFRVTASGMSSIVPVLFAAGDLFGPEIIAILPLYGNTYALLHDLEKSERHNFKIKKLYAGDPSLLLKLYDAINPSTAAIIFEIGGNPTLTFPPIEGIVYVSRASPRAKPLIICDNTFHFGLFKAFNWGVDVIVGSGTKYMVGRSSWPLGYFGVSKRCLAEAPELWKKAQRWTNWLGATLGFVEAWLTSVCVEDVTQRVVQHSINALAVAEVLESHPLIEKVIYPGLASYPQQETVLRYLEEINGQRYFGGVVSFYLKGAKNETTQAFLDYLTAHTSIQHKASLGGSDNMIESPLILSHKDYSPEDRLMCKLSENNVRFSVGLGNPEETIEELNMALWTVLR